MVVTESLARGAVRAAADKNSKAGADVIARLKKAGIEPPATRRRFSQWFHKHNAAFEKYALLFVFGMIGRRRGRFSVYLPYFEEVGADWNFGVEFFSVECSPGSFHTSRSEMLPVRISGHALERMFQRINTIDWALIRECLAGATLFLNAVAAAYIDSGCKQCAIPAEKGMLVGQIDDEILYLRTFLADSKLSPRWQSLYNELLAFSESNKEMINGAALTPDDAAGQLFSKVLKSGRHGWLQRAYVPGDDLLEDAWRAKA